MLIPKEIIRPGIYWYEDAETRQPRQFEATDEYIRYLRDQGNAMRSAGLSIPLPLEHQAEAKPLTKSERAANTLLNNAGWVDSFLIENNRLFGMCEVDDKKYPGIVEKLPSTIKYTSPWITSFMDGDGKKWEGVIGHLALTSRPRITRQEPFPNIAAALSLASMLPPVNVAPVGAYLSPAGRLKVSGSKVVPARPMAFGVWSGVSLAAAPPVEKPKEKKAEKKPPKESKPSSGGKPPMDDEEGESFEEGEGAPQEMKKMGLLDVLIELMDAIFDVQLPEGITDKQLLPEMIKACTGKLKGETGGLEDEQMDKPNDLNGPGAKPPVVEERPPVFMSLEQVSAITDPTQKRLAEMVLSLQGTVETEKKRNSALAANTLASALERRDARIERLCKRLSPPVQEELKNYAKSIALSLGDDGKTIDPLEQTLNILEKSSRDLPALLQNNREQLIEEPQPKDYNGTVTEERRKAIVAEMVKNTGMDRGAKAG